jgi:surface antigen
MKRMTLALMVLVGTLAGALAAFGQEGGDLAAPEQQAMSDTVQYALENNPSNQSSDWVNPDTGNSGGVTPVRTFTGAQGQPCREFTSTIVVAGQQQQGYGTACRQPDGTWRIVSDEAEATQAPPPAQTNIYVNNPPPEYYYYPAGFYYPYHIYLSFSYVYRGGHPYRGSYFLDGRSFRHRHPIHVRERVFITPRDPYRYQRLRNWWQYRQREVDRGFRRYGRRGSSPERGYERREDRREWRDLDRGRGRRRGGNR